MQRMRTNQCKVTVRKQNGTQSTIRNPGPHPGPFLPGSPRVASPTPGFHEIAGSWSAHLFISQTWPRFPAAALRDALGLWGVPQTSCIQASCLQPHCPACWGCLPWSSGEDWAGQAMTTSLPNRLILLFSFCSLPIVKFWLGQFPQFLKELCQGTCVAFPTAWVKEFELHYWVADWRDYLFINVQLLSWNWAGIFDAFPFLSRMLLSGSLPRGRTFRCFWRVLLLTPQVGESWFHTYRKLALVSNMLLDSKWSQEKGLKSRL